MRGGKKIKNIGLAKVSAWLPFLFSKFCLSLVLCQNGLLFSFCFLAVDGCWVVRYACT